MRREREREQMFCQISYGSWCAGRSELEGSRYVGAGELLAVGAVLL